MSTRCSGTRWCWTILTRSSGRRTARRCWRRRGTRRARQPEHLASLSIGSDRPELSSGEHPERGAVAQDARDGGAKHADRDGTYVVGERAQSGQEADGPQRQAHQRRRFALPPVAWERVGTPCVDEGGAQDGVREAAGAHSFFRPVLPAQISPAGARAEGGEQDEVALAGDAPRRLDELHHGAVVGALVGVAGGEPAPHGSRQADDGIGARHHRVHLSGVGQLGDERLRVVAQRMPIGRLGAHVRDDVEPGRAQAWNEDAPYGAGGASDEDGRHGRQRTLIKVGASRCIGLCSSGAVMTWPTLQIPGWQETRATMHMWAQIVGKTRLALAPFQNHWWHVPLYLSSRGLTTSAVPWRDHTLELEFDLIRHVLEMRSSLGQTAAIPLASRPVAHFFRDYLELLESFNVRAKFLKRPVEVREAIYF